MKNPETGKRFVALSAAVAIGLGGVALTVPAMAANEAPEELSVAAASAFNASKNIAAVGYGADGQVVAQVVEGNDLSADSDELSAVAAFAEETTDDTLVVEEIPNGYSAANATDVVGGAGYAVAPNGGDASAIEGLCSFGFPATNAAGDEAIITAGHCADEGASVFLERPSTANANNDPHAAPYLELLKDTSIGSFTHSQFGPQVWEGDQDPGAYTPENAQDFAVITLDDDTIETHGEVTDWSSAGSDDLFASTTDITGVADVTTADIGEDIFRSGRTSGQENATIGTEENASIGIVDGYAPIGMPDGSAFMVHGFAAEGLAIPGDSGGAVVKDDKAIGVVSGSNYNPATDEGNFIWAAELDEGLTHIDGGYEIKTAGDDAEPSPTPTATEDPTQEPTETPDPTPTATEDPTQEPTDTPEPTPTATETGEPTETPEPTPTDTDSPEPTETATDEPTTPAPTPSETEEADEDAELTVDPREIAAEQFLAEDEDQAIEQDRGVTYSVTGVEPGSDVTFDTYASTDSASANAGSEEAPAEDSNDAPAKSVTVTADEDGNASSRVWGLPTAPAEAYIGDYEVIVTAEGETLESSFEVVGEGGGDGGQDDGDNGEGGDDLPRTGSTTAPLAAGAAGLVALGGALVYVARRRRA